MSAGGNNDDSLSFQIHGDGLLADGSHEIQVVADNAGCGYPLGNLLRFFHINRDSVRDRSWG